MEVGSLYLPVDGFFRITDEETVPLAKREADIGPLYLPIDKERSDYECGYCSIGVS